MSGYDTHHATLAQTAGEQAWGDVLTAAGFWLLVAGFVWIVVGVPACALWRHLWTRRYDRDHEQRQANRAEYDAVTGGDHDAAQRFIDAVRRRR